MTKQNTLRDIEKKTYISYHQDGLIDIIIGLYALSAATLAKGRWSDNW